jgi:hypothetical protein
LGNRFIPSDKNGQLLMNYLGPPKTFPHVSISDILGGKLPRGMFTDKIVLVGAIAVGTHDLLSTPLSPLYPAVEVHAMVIDNILTQNFLTRPNWSKTYDLLAIITLGVLIGITLPRIGALKGLLCAMGLGVLYLVIACWLFVHAGVWLTLVYPFLALSTNYLGLSLQPVIDPYAGAVLADPTQIQQVVLNLCTNAAHAMRETGGVIEVHLEPVDLPTDYTTVTAVLRAGPYVRLLVRDTGDGMAPEIRERIFEPFFTTKSIGEGTGMGLAVVHGIVTSYGGASLWRVLPGRARRLQCICPALLRLPRPRSTQRSHCPGGMSAYCWSMTRRPWSS